MLHAKETVYRKLRMNAQILPPEILILIRDLDKRIVELEEGCGCEKIRTEKPSTDRRKANKLPEGEVPSNSLPTGSD